MNLDDLKNQWAAYDNKLEQSIKLNAALLRQSTLDKADSALQRLTRVLFVELIINFIAVIYLGSFIADHIGQLKFLLPALVLDLPAIALIAFTIHQIVMLRGIDYSSSVIVIQKRLESLRIKRIQATKWTLLIAPLLWTPLLIVIMKGLLGLDAYVIFSHYWLISNLLFGLAIIPLMILVSKRYADRWQGSPLMQQLMNDIAGSSLTTALSFLDKLHHYEKESE